MIVFSVLTLLTSFNPSVNASENGCAFPPNHPQLFNTGKAEAYYPAQKMLEAHHTLDACLEKSDWNLALSTREGVTCYQPHPEKGDMAWVSPLKSPFAGTEGMGPLAIYGASKDKEFTFSKTKNCNEDRVIRLAVNHRFGSKLGACADFQNNAPASAGLTLPVGEFPFLHFGEDAKKCIAASNKHSHRNQNEVEQSIKSTRHESSHAIPLQPSEAAQGLRSFDAVPGK